MLHGHSFLCNEGTRKTCKNLRPPNSTSSLPIRFENSFDSYSEKEPAIFVARIRMERGRLLPFLALQAMSEYSRLDRKPPITAALVAANTLIYLRPKFLDPIIPSIDEVWFNAHLILKYKDLKRFLLSPFYHIGESHLVYNMVSLLWKGVRLESSKGSSEFASMVAILLGLSQGITLLMCKSLLLLGYRRAYYREYAVGFSGVLFAMKVVLNAESDNYTNVYGLMVPARHAAWAELILIQMFVPGVSFLGHLGGILAGILYLRFKDIGSHGGLVRGLARVVTSPLRYMLRLFSSPRQRISGRGRVGRDNQANGSGVWRCEACTYDNSDRLNVCEMCGTGRDGDGLSSFGSSGETHDLPLDELRYRRMQRFIR